MTTPFADLFASQWPLMLATHGESVTYTDALGAGHIVTAMFVPRHEDMALDNSWETRARQAELYVDVDSLSGVTCTPRQDTITARGVVYTVMERDEGNGAIYRYLLERQEVEAVQGYGRRF